MKLFKVILLSGSILLAANSFAITDKQNNSVATHSEYSLSQITQNVFEKLSQEQQQNISSMWGLSVTDYSHYLWLMGNTPNGIYYADKNLDPSWILGMNASNEEELKKYAAIAIKNERARIQKELAFQREFTRLTKALFPNEKPINLAAAYEK